MNNILKQIYLNGIVPVVVMDDYNHAVPLAQALLNGGVGVIEITFRTSAAKNSIAEITKHCPNMLVGAGTVINIDMANQAAEAGAKFIVSPGLDEELVRWGADNDILVIPGIATASEAQAAIKMDVTTVKIFPAEKCGGPDYIKTLGSVFKNLKFMPTGGVSLDNMCSYLDLPNVISCGGSWVCPRNLILEERFNEIEIIVKKSVLKMHDFKLLHIGMNSKDENEAHHNAKEFADMFGIPLIDYPASFFAGTLIEVIKSPFYGEHGHIAISTNNIERSINYFENRGYKFRPVHPDPKKGIVAIYFEKEIGGFALHLRRKL